VTLFVDKSIRFERFVKVIDLLKANKLETLSIVARGN
jgi:biopolymer transport protein ExbD